MTPFYEFKRVEFISFGIMFWPAEVISELGNRKTTCLTIVFWRWGGSIGITWGRK